MNFRHEIIIYWNNKSQSFIAEVPELTGCIAHGVSYKEALEGIEIVVEKWIQRAKLINRPIPKPKGKLAFG